MITCNFMHELSRYMIIVIYLSIGGFLYNYNSHDAIIGVVSLIE